MTLCEPGELPPFLRPLEFVALQAEIVCARDVTVVYDEKLPKDMERMILQYSVDAAAWNVEGGRTLMSMFDLSERLWAVGAVSDIRNKPLEFPLHRREFSLTFAPPNPRVWLAYGSMKIFAAGATVVDVLERINGSAKPEILSYEQHFVDGTVAWAALARIQANGREINVQYGFAANPDGTMRVTSHRFNIPGTRTLRTVGSFALANIPTQ